MKRILICLVTCLLIAVSLPALVSGEDVSTTSHQITISTQDNFLMVNEILTVKGVSNESLEILVVWVQDDGKSVEILINSKEPDSIVQNGNEYSCNISSFGIKKEDITEIKISYELNKNVEYLKKVVRDTDDLSVIFNQKQIFTAQNLASNSTINLQLYKLSEPTLQWYITVILALMIILVAVLAAYVIRKRKSVKTKGMAGGSEEFLTTKKTVLMSILKDIEKQHRAKEISDDTYHKLKEQYKQEAIEAMKLLEDMQSKV